MAGLGIAAIVLSFLLLAAHVMRSGGLPLAMLVAAFSLLLFVPRKWAARVIQIILVLGAVEWVATIVAIANERREEGRPWLRMAIILGAVALWTLLSAAAFRIPALARRYGLAS